MKATFYSSSAEKNRIDKTSYLSGDFETDILLKENCGMLTPVLIISASVTDKNYLYIPLFERYYFITNITRLDNNRVEISCKCDVLMSHKEDILKLKVIATRSSNKYNQYLTDKAIAIESDYFPIVRRISKGLFQSNTLTEDNYTFALTVINKKGATSDG